MASIVDSFDLFNLPETVEKMLFPSSHHSHDHTREGRVVSNIPVDILDNPKEYVFFMDVPGLSKFVIRSNGKRKREEGDDEGCKYLRLERRAPHKLQRKFRLPENANPSAITAKCENGVLTVTVEKHPPPPKSKTVEIAIA